MPRLARRRSASSAEVILRRASSLAPIFFFASPCVRQQTHAPPCAANSLMSFAGCIAAPSRQCLARILDAGRQRLSVVRLIPAASNRVCKTSFYTASRVNSDASASSLLASPKHMAVVDRQVKTPTSHNACFPNNTHRLTRHAGHRATSRCRPQRTLLAQTRSAQPHRHLPIPPVLADGSRPVSQVHPALSPRHGLA